MCVGCVLRGFEGEVGVPPQFSALFGFCVREIRQQVVLQVFRRCVASGPAVPVEVLVLSGVLGVLLLLRVLCAGGRAVSLQGGGHAVRLADRPVVGVRQQVR